MNKEFLKMQKIAGLITENQFRQLNENQARYFIVIVAGGTSDELGNMKGVSASTQEEFIQNLENIYGKNLESVGLTFYEVPNQNEMNRIAQMSEDWYTGDESGEEELMSVAEKGKPFNDISF